MTKELKKEGLSQEQGGEAGIEKNCHEHPQEALLWPSEVDGFV